MKKEEGQEIIRKEFEDFSRGLVEKVKSQTEKRCEDV